MASFSRQTQSCIHGAATTATPRSGVCEECGSGFNLRVCTECGHVGCCESQHGHDTAHYRATGHAVIASLPLGRGGFTWCYACRRYL